ncbi:MAG: thiamine-phosphate kinase [Thermoprotei archaeon]|nr:thiamine-phosphate kinase [Thermoprotei archaeon]
MIRVAKLGERGLIKRIWAIITERGLSFSAVPKTFDDAIAYRYEGGYVVLTNDGVNEKTDKLPGMSWRDLGWRLGTMCVSDLAAKGCQPLGMLISLNVPRSMYVEAIDELYHGLIDAAQEYGFEIWGGDMGEASEVVADGFMIGLSRKEPIWRCGIRPGDVILVSGDFGLTGAAFHYLLKSGRAINEGHMRRILEAAYRPRARLELGLALAELNCINAMMDSSDGLAESLHQLSEASGVGIVVHEIPVAKEALEYANANNLDVNELVFYGGEEYELVFAIEQRKVKDALDVLRDRGFHIRVIGKAFKGAGVFIKDHRGKLTRLKRGWEHYR